MTSDTHGKGPKVPTEHPDPKAAASGGSGRDRPGFDLGGAADRTGSEGLRNPKGSPAAGSDAAGRASGASDLSGSRSLGNEGDTGSDSGGGAH